MRTFRINNKDFQFSYDKFYLIYKDWNPQEHEGLSMQQFLEQKLYITKDSLYNYLHRRNGMDCENIKNLAELLAIPLTDLLEEKTMKERNKIMKNNIESNDMSISNFSKNKVYETITAIEECIFAFFATFKAEDEFFDVMEALRFNSIAIPDELLDDIEYFVYEDLDKLISNPDDVFDQLPPICDSLETTRARSRKLIDIENDFMDKYFNPLKEEVKRLLIEP